MKFPVTISTPRGKKQIPLPLVLLGSLLLAIPFHLRPDNFIVDDGYFYPQIARFIIHGQGSTFNGITPTNGYHPLWMIVCIVAAKVTSESSPLIQIIAMVQDLFTIVSVALIVTIARRAHLHGALLGCMPILFFGMVLGIWRLLEANLALALQLGTLVLTVPILPGFYERTRRWQNILTGCMLGLLMLARLDLLFFAITVLAWGFFKKDPPRTLWNRFSSLVIQGGTAALLLTPYLLWNWHHFRHLLPISGAIKSTFPHVQHWGVASFMYPVVLALILNSALLLKRNKTSFDTLCLLTTAAAALHLAYTISFGGLAPWYLTTGYLAVSFAVICTVDSLFRIVPSLSWIEPALAALLFVAFLALGTLRLVSNFTYTHLIHGQLSFHVPYLEPKRALAIKLRETLPSASNIMIFDAPGGVAFYSGMHLLPIDGLVSDYAYNKELAKDGLAAYLGRKHIDFFIAPYVRQNQTYDRLFLKEQRASEGQTIEVQAPLTRQIAGTLLLPDSDLVFRFREINPDLETIYPEVGVWRIQHKDVSATR